MKDVFTRIYEKNEWGGLDSVSGPGSSLKSTRLVRRFLSEILHKYEIDSMLDIPCGDFHWMSEVDLAGVQYIGADIVEQVVAKASGAYTTNSRRFLQLDLTQDILPPSTLIFTRDCLVHLSHEDAVKALRNIAKTEARFFITTSFIEQTTNNTCISGGWRALNLFLPPYNFPEALEIQNEGHGGKYPDKSLILWHLDELRPIIENIEPSWAKLNCKE